MNFLEKLDLLMAKYELNKRSLSQKSGIPYTTIDAWYKKGYEGLKLTTLRKLNEYFNTTLDFWILDEVTDPNYGKTSGFKVNYEEMEHIKKYRSLDPHGQETVNYIIEREKKRADAIKNRDKQIEEKNSRIINLEAQQSAFSSSTADLLPLAAHNDHLTEDGEQEKIARDLQKLVRPK